MKTEKKLAKHLAACTISDIVKFVTALSIAVEDNIGIVQVHCQRLAYKRELRPEVATKVFCGYLIHQYFV